MAEPAELIIDGVVNPIAVVAVDHEVSAPYDAGTGMLTGARVHQPLTITKPVDASSPLLYQGLVNGQVFPVATLRFFASGTTVNDYTIHLEQVRVVAIRSEMLNVTYQENAPLAPREKVAMIFQIIRWTWEPGAVEFEDSLTGV